MSENVASQPNGPRAPMATPGASDGAAQLAGQWASQRAASNKTPAHKTGGVQRRSQKLREEIDQLKAFIPAAGAPLASLEFSISFEQPNSLQEASGAPARPAPAERAPCDSGEPESGQRAPARTSERADNSGSSVDTQTLSGYQDCDELSDMVDDSLFEITAAGCLSRSVFPRGPGGVADAAGASDEQRAGPFACATRRQVGAKMAHSSQISSIMAHVQSHDYSCTSSVPRHVRSSLTGAPSAGRPRNAAALEGAQIANKRARARPLEDHLASSEDNALGESIAAAPRPSAHQPARRARASLSERQQPQQVGGQQCPECAASSANVTSKKQKRKTMSETRAKRTGFGFKLFNLFTSGAGEQSAPATATSEPPADHNCQLHAAPADSSTRRKRARPAGQTQGAPDANNQQHQRTGQRAAGRPARPAGGARDQPLPGLRLRDSIKITNQRKLRSAAPGAGTQADGSRPQPADEVLLDLATGARHRLPGEPAEANLRLRAHSTASRLNKCVKFTTPDRVVVLAGEPAAGRRRVPPATFAAGHSSSHNNLATHDRPTPIIKLPSVAKSSSYSQTDSSQGLEELLAKYEQNNQLVAEINEKLKLTDTIASNLSALDRRRSLDDDAAECAAHDAVAYHEVAHAQEAAPSELLNDGHQDDESSIDEDDLIRRQLDIIEAASVFGWRAEDELRGPGARDHLDEERAEAERAAMCECNREHVAECPPMGADQCAATPPEPRTLNIGHKHPQPRADAPDPRAPDKMGPPEGGEVSLDRSKLAKGSRGAFAPDWPPKQTTAPV